MQQIFYIQLKFLMMQKNIFIIWTYSCLTLKHNLKSTHNMAQLIFLLQKL